MKIELTHDLLAKKIYDTGSIQDKARLRAERFVQERFKFYESAPQLLMNDQELDFVIPYLNGMELSSEQESFVAKSQQKVYREQRNAKIKSYLMVGMFCSFIFSGWALFERYRADYEHGIAQHNQQQADSLLIDLHTLTHQIRAVQNTNDLQQVISEVNQIQQNYLQNQQNVALLQRNGLLDTAQQNPFARPQITLRPLCIEGFVASPQGKPIEGAEILLFGMHSQTNNTGHFHVHILADPSVLPNSLPLEITHAGFEPYSNDIAISKNFISDSKISISPILQPQPNRPQKMDKLDVGLGRKIHYK